MATGNRSQTFNYIKVVDNLNLGVQTNVLLYTCPAQTSAIFFFGAVQAPSVFAGTPISVKIFRLKASGGGSIEVMNYTCATDLVNRWMREGDNTIYSTGSYVSTFQPAFVMAPGDTLILNHPNAGGNIVAWVRETKQA